MSRKRSEPAGPASVHLRLEGEVVGLWFEMQSRLQGHFTAFAAQHGLSAVQARALLQLRDLTSLRGLLRSALRSP
ncbi:MAG: hypothetical protein PVSMB3_05560 [Candidatus Dormibacteraceae bacterium]